MGTSISFLPDGCSCEVDGCPLLNRSTDPDQTVEEVNHGKVVVACHTSFKYSMAELLTEGRIKDVDLMEWTPDCQLDKWNLSFVQAPFAHVRQYNLSFIQAPFAHVRQYNLSFVQAPFAQCKAIYPFLHTGSTRTCKAI